MTPEQKSLKHRGHKPTSHSSRDGAKMHKADVTTTGAGDSGRQHHDFKTNFSKHYYRSELENETNHYLCLFPISEMNS